MILMEDAFEALLSRVSLAELEVFCDVARTLNFTAVAHRKGLTPAAVSKTVGRLENHLGCPLVIRSTREMRLTDAGKVFADKCLTALRMIAEAQQQIADQRESPSGKVRLSLPTAYAHWRVLPIIGKFRSLYPKITLDLHVSNRIVDLPAEDFDLVVRGRDLGDSTLMALKLEDAELALVASASYLNHSPPLHVPADLRNHECIAFSFPRTGRPAPWLFRIEGQIHEFEPQGSITCEQEFLGGIALAKGGAGIYQVYKFAVERELAAGELCEVLPQFGGRTLPFYLAYPKEAKRVPKIKAFIEFLRLELGRSTHPLP